MFVINYCSIKISYGMKLPKCNKSYNKLDLVNKFVRNASDRKRIKAVASRVTRAMAMIRYSKNSILNIF